MEYSLNNFDDVFGDNNKFRELFYTHFKDYAKLYYNYEKRVTIAKQIFPNLIRDDMIRAIQKNPKLILDHIDDKYKFLPIPITAKVKGKFLTETLQSNNSSSKQNIVFFTTDSIDSNYIPDQTLLIESQTQNLFESTFNKIHFNQKELSSIKFEDENILSEASKLNKILGGYIYLIEWIYPDFEYNFLFGRENDLNNDNYYLYFDADKNFDKFLNFLCAELIKSKNRHQNLKIEQSLETNYDLCKERNQLDIYNFISYNTYKVIPYRDNIDNFIFTSFFDKFGINLTLVAYTWNFEFDKELYDINKIELPPVRHTFQSDSYNMYLQKTFTDFTVETETNIYYVHKMILYMNGGQYMKTLLSQNLKEAQESKLKIEGYPEDIIKIYIDYIYLGSDILNDIDIDITQLYILADYLDHYNLKLECLHIINATSKYNDIDTLQNIYNIHPCDNLKNIINALKK
jgi:hypothetical protein